MRRVLCVLLPVVFGIPSSQWLSFLPDDLLIADIPILPGSHNSGSAKPRSINFGPYYVARQQSLSVLHQLLAGVRFLDIRLRYDTRGVVRVSHGLDTSYIFSELLGEVKAFLDSHASEFVVVMIRGDWPAERTFPLTRDSIAELVNVLKKSGVHWAQDVDINSTLGSVRGKCVLVADYFPYAPEVEFNVPYMAKREQYQVCDIWDDTAAEKPAVKISRFMQSTKEVNVGLSEQMIERSESPHDVYPRVCDALPGSKLFTGVALDRTHAYIVPPCLTSHSWNGWFIDNLETNPFWRPQLDPVVPVGVVLIDFAEPKLLKRLIDVGFRMLNQTVEVDAIDMDFACSIIVDDENVDYFPVIGIV